MALASLDRVSFTYPHANSAALDDVTLRLEPGDRVAVLGPSGSGKSTLVRALAGLVPHFHGGRFSGRATVVGRDTRTARPADLAGEVATVFQDPEDQVVMTIARNEVAFALENVATPPAEIWPRVAGALASVSAAQLGERRTTELSGGELARALAFATRVLYLERGRILLDAALPEAVEWLRAHRPPFAGDMSVADRDNVPSDAVVTIDDAWFSYGDRPVLEGVSLVVRRGEVVALEGPNGSGKSTLAKLAAGLLEPRGGIVRRQGRAGYLSQDPGRYLACERALDEVALGVGGDRERALDALDVVGLRWAADRHPRDLSSGERERLGIAAVAVAEPDLLVLDEPTRGVDPERKAELAAWFEGYAERGRGVLIATHDRSFPADRRVALAAPAREEALVAA